MLILFVCGKFTVGQDRERKISIADSVLLGRGEVYFSFSSDKFTQAASLFLSIKKVVGNKVFAYANAAGFRKFLKLGADFQLQPENFPASRLKSTQISNPDLVYPSYPSYIETIEAFAKQYPSFCRLAQIGTSVKGRKIMALQISAFNGAEGKPSVLLTSSIHGNELVGFKFSLWMIDYMLGNYKKNSLVTKLMDNANIWILPLLNPDGTYYGGDYTVTEATRFNANNLDLNRNFPDPADGLYPDNAARQPETLALMEFYKKNGIVLSAALHTGDELINYPWDTWAKHHPDDLWYRYVSKQYVDSVHKKNALYMTDFENGIVNGYRWYRITGGQQDYVNYFLHSREITVELSKSDMPDSVTLARFWEYNREPLLHFLEQSLYSFNGRVTNKNNGIPLKARIELTGHDQDNSWVLSNETGHFARFVYPGQYSVNVSSPGYIPASGQIVTNHQEALMADFQLEPVGNPVAVYPNPFQYELNFVFTDSLLSSEIRVSLTDLNGRTIFIKELKNFTGYNFRLEFPEFPDGIYLLKIAAGNINENFRLLKMD